MFSCLDTIILNGNHAPLYIHIQENFLQNYSYYDVSLEDWKCAADQYSISNASTNANGVPN